MDDLPTRLRRWTHAVDAVPASDLMDEAAAEIERLRDERQWIPVSERLPDNGDTVWCFDADGVGLCEYNGPHSGFQTYGASCDIEGLHSDTLLGVTHWMELQSPEPPEVTK